MTVSSYKDNESRDRRGEKDKKLTLKIRAQRCLHRVQIDPGFSS
jgi:hypothetical protein